MKFNNFLSFYLFRVLKQVDPDLSISNISLKLLNLLLSHVFEQFTHMIGDLVDITKCSTLEKEVIQTATQHVLPGDLHKYAISEGAKALVRFNASSETPSSNNDSQSFSLRAGLVFPVDYFSHLLCEEHFASQVSNEAAIFITAVFEYLSFEIVELAGHVARDKKQKTISPFHIHLAISFDDDLLPLFKTLQIVMLES